MVSTPASVSATEPQPTSVLADKLASVLPLGFKFGVYHLSTPPTKTIALYHEPPGARPDKTFREQHFLTVTIDPRPKPASDNDKGGKRVLVLAIEVYIYTTAFTTTLFVSKADSTGYLHHLGLPKGTPSPIREISSAFVAFLLESRQRKGVQAIVNLFARSQDQYLFPRSIENKGKHLLDDRGLVKWWCRVLDPMLGAHSADGDQGSKTAKAKAKAYLIVPGLDNYETRAFLPRSPSALSSWILGHPLEQISRHNNKDRPGQVPIRCLIPRYPDDPKSRFRDELDEEGANLKQEPGSWRSVKTLDQFWEMMAFRQECSSGRLTGFIWLVFDPERPRSSIAKPEDRLEAKTNDKAADLSKKAEKKKRKKSALRGPIEPRQPRIKRRQEASSRLLKRPERTAYYYWPCEGRGRRIVDEPDYKRATELLLRLDFATLDKALASTERWIGEVALGRGARWGIDVSGKREVEAAPVNGVGEGSATEAATGAVNNLSGLIKRKRGDHPKEEAENGEAVNVLGAGLVRKKPKLDEQSSLDTASSTVEAPPKVNVLGAGLVRRKPKP